MDGEFHKLKKKMIKELSTFKLTIDVIEVQSEILALDFPFVELVG